MQNDSQYSAGEMHAEDIIISSRDIDSNYEPSIEEVKQYGVFLGMDPEEDQEFMYIAEKGLKAPIPAPWKACQTKDGQIYYFNFNTGESQWEHPCDGEFRKEFRLAKELARETEVKTGNKDVEQNILNKEVISNRVNPLEISDLSALLTNQSERGNKNILDDSIISGFDDIHKSRSKEQVNSDEQASQEGKKEQGNENSPGKLSRTKNGVNILDFENMEKKDNNATKNQELQKIEAEFQAKLENYEKELFSKYEQALLAQKQALENHQKVNEALNQEEIDDIEEDIEDRLLDEIVNSAIDDESEKLKDQDALLVNEKLNSLQYNYVLALKAGRDELNLQIQEAERVRSLLLMGNSTISQDYRKVLLAEYKKSLQKAELDQQEKLDNEIKLLKSKLSTAYAERGSVKEKSEVTSFEEMNNPEFFCLQREYDDRLQQEKENMYLQIQETKKNMHKEYAHTYTIPEESKEKKNALYSKIKGIEDERAQYFKLLQGSKETLHSQILRKYELQKLAFENGAGERASGSKKEVKNVDRDLKSVENLFNLLNKLNEEKKSIEKELLAKDSQKYELMMGIKELELSLKEVMQQTEQYEIKIENFKSNTNNRNQMLQKINETQVQIDSIGKEIKEKEKVRRTSYQSAPRKSNDFARQSLEQLLRKVEGIKDAVTAKQKRRSVTPGQRPYEHSFERRSYFPETETEDASPGFNNRIATADILGMTFQGRDKRSRSSDRRQTDFRSSKRSQLHDMSIDFSKEFKRNRSQWYSTLDADEDKITKNNSSDIWSGLEIEKFKHDLEKEGSFYGKQEKHYKNSENEKSSKYLNKGAFYTSLEQYKTRNTEGDEAFTPAHEIGKGMSGNYSFLDRQRNWISTQGPVLGLRDPNLKKISTCSTYKNSPTRYGRKSLQNTSEIMNRHEYQRGFAYPIKDNDSFNSRARSIEKKEPTRFLNIKHKIRDERHFHQYDTLIKKYSSGL